MNGVSLLPGKDAPAQSTGSQLTNGDVDHGTDTSLRNLSFRHSKLLKAMKVSLVKVRPGLNEPRMVVGDGYTTLGRTTPSIWYGKLDGQRALRTNLRV